MHLFHRMLLALAAIFFIVPAQAADVTPSEIAPSKDDTTVFTLHSSDGNRPISLAQIELSSIYAVELQHFEGPKGTFAGVWLDDFIDAEGLDNAATLRFIAHDDYTVFITPRDRQQQRLLLVTRLNDEPIPLTEFGPTMLINPADAEAVEAGTASMTSWIWSIRDIYLQ